MPYWDYSWRGTYFVTVCTSDHKCFFGEIKGDKMHPNEYGKIVENEWKKSFEIRKELQCDGFVLMPNHIHAIAQIVEFGGIGVETHGGASLQISPEQKTQKNSIAIRSPKSISSFIAGFKSSATLRINALRGKPGARLWQPRFYDHVIRTKQEFHAIRQYIQDNLLNWDEDRNAIEMARLNEGRLPWRIYMP
jgi:putative transposase